VKASLERVVSLGIKSVTGVRLSVIDGYAEFVGNPAVGLRGLHVLDDHTLEVRLAAPLGTLDLLLSDPSFGIVPAGTSSDNAAFAGTPVGSGPFVVTSRTEDTITTERRDGSRAALSGITLRLFADTESAHAAFVVGELDMAVLASTDVASAEARGDLLLSAPHQVSTFYGMNVSSPVLSSPALRDAIVKAVDRDGVVTATVDRSTLRAAQYPRGFATGELARLLAAGEPDEVAAAIRLRVPVTVVEGDGDAFVADLPGDAAYVDAVIACSR